MPYGMATAAINPYENRPAVPKSDLPSFEALQVANIYEQDTSSFFPTGSRPVVTNVPPPAMPQQQMAPNFQQGQRGYSFGQQPMQPQQGAPNPISRPFSSHSSRRWRRRTTWVCPPICAEGQKNRMSDDQPGRDRRAAGAEGDARTLRQRRPGCDETLESEKHQRSNS